MLLLNAFNYLSFRPFTRRLSLFRSFSVCLKIASHASNKCVLSIFLLVPFLALPAFTYETLHASNKCLLAVFLSVPFFLVLLTLFPSIFTPHLDLSCMILINAYCPSFFPSLFHLLALFPLFFTSLSILFPPFFPASFKASLACFYKCILPSFFPPLSSPFRTFSALFPSYLNIVSHASSKCVLPIFFPSLFPPCPPLRIA
jgi:hypothetical protein